jgi:hypothetical protein
MLELFLEEVTAGLFEMFIYCLMLVFCVLWGK